VATLWHKACRLAQRHQYFVTVPVTQSLYI
jgi:hypothetical protein